MYESHEEPHALPTRRNYCGEPAADLINPLLKVLSLARQISGGDMDKALIMLLVLVRSASHPDFVRATSGEPHGSGTLLLPSLGTNVSSVAASLRIPKETTRRKVNQLIESGCLTREGSDLLISRQVYEDLAPLRAEVCRMAMRCHEVVAALRLEAKSLGQP